MGQIDSVSRKVYLVDPSCAIGKAFESNNNFNVFLQVMSVFLYLFFASL